MTATLTEPAADTGVLSVDELVSLDDEAFGDYVFDHLGTGPAWPALLQPQTVERTRVSLKELLADLDDTVAEKRRELSVAAFRDWQADEVHGKRSLIGRRLAAVKNAAKWAADQEKSLERRAFKGVVGRLAEAIHVHRLAAIEAGLEPEPNDRALWAVLSTLTVPVKGEDVQLDEALGRGLIGGGR
jgi:hypothetical protein